MSNTIYFPFPQQNTPRRKLWFYQENPPVYSSPFRANVIRPRAIFSLGLAVLFTFIAGRPAAAERPSAPDLLPADTLVFIRVADTKELMEKLSETSVGQMLADEEIRPLAGQLYNSLADAYARIEEQVGVSLDQLLALPDGEICAALLAQEEGPPALVVLIDVGANVTTADKLIDRGEELLESGNTARDTQLFGDTELVVHKDQNRQERQVIYFKKDETIGICTSVEAAKQVLRRWTGEQEKDDKTLGDERKFTTIMSRCRGTKDERPQFTWYADPIAVVRNLSRGNTTAQIGLSILPTLGLDGLQAVGGSLIYATEEFDGIAHLHIMLDNPRAGVIEMLALESGDTTPEPWVPEDVFSYTTMHWDVDRTYSKLRTMIDSFREDGDFDRMVKTRMSDEIGIDFEEELIDQLEGRMTLVSRFEPPARINSQVNLLALKLKDPDAFMETMKKVVERFPDRTEKEVFGGVTYYRAMGRGGRRAARPAADEGEQEERPRAPIRRPQPCLAIVKDYFMIASSTKMLENVIITSSDANNSLANQDDYQLIAKEIKRQASSSKPGLVTFSRPEEALRMLYDLATSDDTKTFLSSRSEENPFFRTVNTALDDNPLPPFTKIADYFAPGGGMITNDETGFHYTAFSLKPKTD